MSVDTIKLVRNKYEKDTTYGKLIVGEKVFDTIEDAVRDPKIKIKHETAIPEGTYLISANTSPKFKKVLPYLSNVPYFSGIRIHRGSRNEHTSGCILLKSNDEIDYVVKYLKDAYSKRIDVYINIENLEYYEA